MLIVKLAHIGVSNPLKVIVQTTKQKSLKMSKILHFKAEKKSWIYTFLVGLLTGFIVFDLLSVLLGLDSPIAEMEQ